MKEEEGSKVEKSQTEKQDPDHYPTKKGIPIPRFPFVLEFLRVYLSYILLDAQPLKGRL